MAAASDIVTKTAVQPQELTRAIHSFLELKELFSKSVFKLPEGGRLEFLRSLAVIPLTTDHSAESKDEGSEKTPTERLIEYAVTTVRFLLISDEEDAKTAALHFSNALLEELDQSESLTGKDKVEFCTNFCQSVSGVLSAGGTEEKTHIFPPLSVLIQDSNFLYRDDGISLTEKFGYLEKLSSRVTPDEFLRTYSKLYPERRGLYTRDVSQYNLLSIFFPILNGRYETNPFQFMRTIGVDPDFKKDGAKLKELWGLVRPRMHSSEVSYCKERVTSLRHIE